MKLLHKTLQHYLTFSVVIFVVSIPLFYFLVQKLWIKDVDDSLVFQKEKIIAGIQSSPFDSTTISGFTETAAKYDLGISITPLKNHVPEKDSVYYRSFYDETRSHVEPFRELKSVVNIDGKSYQILIRKDLVESVDLIRGIVINQALIFLLLLAGMILLNHFFAKKTWRPFYTLVERLHTFRIDKEEPIQAEKSNIDEFNHLNRSVAKLTENNIRVFRAQKEFTENAAHETQTPLAVIKNQLDLLAQDNNLTKPQSEIIARIDNNVRILSKLNRNLLLLARIENDQYNRTAHTNISAVVSEICSAFEEEVKMKGLSLSLSIQQNVQVISNEFLVHSLMSNLIANSLRHNIPRGKIDIQLNDERFEITNTGPEQSLDESRIFERFYNRKDSGGSGLGLAIAKRICKLMKWEITYIFEGGNKHCFEVKF